MSVYSKTVITLDNATTATRFQAAGKMHLPGGPGEVVGGSGRAFQRHFIP
jgi:hypothetical protein